MNIPEGATHIWEPNDGWKGPPNINRLYYYKLVDGERWVYSPITDWRPSCNGPEWFETETKEGFFKEIVK